MIEIRNIVVATDFSPNAAVAAPFSVELARSFGASIYLIHVFELSLYLTATAADAFAVLSATPAGWIESKTIAEERRVVELATALSQKEKIAVTPVFKKGNPAQTIIQFAGELKDPCIVVATHGHTALYHMLIGSVAEKIVRLSPYPVFSIRPQK